jgi:hypothetical protein
MQGTLAHLAARGSGSEAARRLCSAILRSALPRSVALPSSSSQTRATGSSSHSSAAPALTTAARCFSSNASATTAAAGSTSAAQSEAVRALLVHNRSARRGAVDANLLATATAAAVLQALREANMSASFSSTLHYDSMRQNAPPPADSVSVFFDPFLGLSLSFSVLPADPALRQPLFDALFDALAAASDRKHMFCLMTHFEFVEFSPRSTCAFKTCLVYILIFEFGF